jgi:hypothetical protein
MNYFHDTLNHDMPQKKSMSSANLNLAWMIIIDN